MRFRQTSLIAAVGFGTVWIAAMASCNDEDPNNLLTTNATDMMMTTGGSGGTATDGGGGAGADGGTSSQGGAGATGGQGGQGGDEPEEVINGCTRRTAVDLTGAASPVNVNLPGGPYCMVVAQNATMTFTLPSVGTSRWIGGTINSTTGVKSVDNSSPIYACSKSSPYRNCFAVNNMDCPGGPTFTDPGGAPICSPPIEFLLVGAYPWFDDLDPTTAIKGVVYVE